MHSERVTWTEELIEEKIRECMDGMGIVRMPTRSEIASYYQNEKLTNRISRTYGYYGWANRLGLGIKGSETTTGKVGELIATTWLEDYGFDVQQMSQNYPYDLFVNNCIKVDVKFSNLYETKHGCKFYSF